MTFQSSTSTVTVSRFRVGAYLHVRESLPILNPPVNDHIQVTNGEAIRYDVPVPGITMASNGLFEIPTATVLPPRTRITLPLPMSMRQGWAKARAGEPDQSMPSAGSRYSSRIEM